MARIVVNCFVSQFQFQFRFAIGNSIKLELPRYEGRFIMFDLVSFCGFILSSTWLAMLEFIDNADSRIEHVYNDRSINCKCT